MYMLGSSAGRVILQEVMVSEEEGLLLSRQSLGALPSLPYLKTPVSYVEDKILTYLAGGREEIRHIIMS